MRSSLVETAARLLAEGGPERLTLRRLTAAVGTSTMSVYTHFGSMDDLRAEVAREAFARLRSHLVAVAETDDPVADLVSLGGAYMANATENAHLYRAIFSASERGGGPDDSGFDTFLVLVSGVERCIAVGRFHRADPFLLATQLWANLHGVVSLHQAGLLDEVQALGAARASAGSLFVGFGDDRAMIDRSLAAAVGWPDSPAPD